jgi:hypothetical protein
MEDGTGDVNYLKKVSSSVDFGRLGDDNDAGIPSGVMAMERRKIPYWIQRADFSTAAHEPVDYEEALRVVREYDWDEEVQYRADLEATGGQFCDPGIVFQAQPGNILQVCPRGEGKGYFRYQYVEKKKIFGVFTVRRTRVRSNMDFHWSELPDLLYHYFADNDQWLMYRTAEGLGLERRR